MTGYTLGGLAGNTHSGSTDFFILNLNSIGEKQWIQQRGTSNFDRGEGIEVGDDGYIYVTGSTGGAFDENTNAGGSDIFIFKYDSNGNLQ